MSSSSQMARSPSLMLPSTSNATVRASPSSITSRVQSESTHGSPQTRFRGQSDGALLALPASSSHPLSRVNQSPSTSSPQTSSVSGFSDDALKSSFRERSRSSNRLYSFPWNKNPESSVSPGAPSSLWNKDQHVPRPWKKNDKHTPIPDEQEESFEATRLCVAEATVSILGQAQMVARVGLLAGLKICQYAPVPGLRPVALTLMKIWDSVQMVDTNRLAFLRLTQRCANILLSIRREIEDAGIFVQDELALPVATLDSVYEHINNLMEKEARSPFLKRYLKRRDTASQISDCGDELLETLRIFGLSVQIRTLKTIQAGQTSMQDNQKIILETINQHRIKYKVAGIAQEQINPGLPPSSPHGMLSVVASSTSITKEVISTPPVLPTIKQIHSLEDQEDTRADMDDLRSLIRTALQTGSDSDIVAFLQVPREEFPEAIKSLQRAMESGKECCDVGEDCIDGVEIKDPLHREFMESGIDALRRLSKGAERNLPSWTITKYEVDLEQKIGVGFFSDVYKGTWKGRTVAIKLLTDATPHKLFIREMGIWKTLQHPNVLELFGGSSTTGDPPWFFVSPYEKNGSLVEYLRRISLQEDKIGLGFSVTTPRLPSSRSSDSFRKDSRRVLDFNDMLRFMQEISQGMEYLHSRGILHGDLKASNVLVDNDLRCVMSDFGLSEMKSEAYRISGLPAPGGALRWQAPELMAGISQLTPAIDVYAYAITCIEIMTMGQLPWAMMDDNAVRYFVLKENNRPPIPESFRASPVQGLLELCWHLDMSMRPSFNEIVGELRHMRRSSLIQMTDEKSPAWTRSPMIPELPETDDNKQIVSPDLCPATSPHSSPAFVRRSVGSSVRESFRKWNFPQTSPTSTNMPQSEETLPTDCTQSSEPVLYVPSDPPSSASSMYTDTAYSTDNGSCVHESCTSLPPPDGKVSEAKNERRYRILLAHEYHPSLTVPLWEPFPVQLGDVGYLSKPKGTFVKLFNAFIPWKSSGTVTKGMPSIAGYGFIARGYQRQDKRNAAQRGFDAFAGLLTFRTRKEVPIARRYSFPLRAGHKSTYMCTETTEYQYMKKLDAPKAWFKANVDSIMEHYGAEHSLHKEDLILVIGALQASHYALFVNHNHPDGQVHFNVFAHPKKGQPWGTFTTDSKVPTERDGPCYNEPVTGKVDSASKISLHDGPINTLLLARLRFKPDVAEPTSL